MQHSFDSNNPKFHRPPFMSTPKTIGPMEYCGLSIEEKLKLQSVVTSLGINTLQSDKPPASVEFLGLHRKLNLLKKIKNLPISIKKAIDQAHQLTYRFEKLLLQIEMKGMTPESHKEMHSILSEILLLEEKEERYQINGFANIQLEIQLELKELHKKVKRTAQWLEFQQKINLLQNSIAYCIEEMDFYQAYEMNSGLLQIDPARGFRIYRELRSSLDQILNFYEQLYLTPKINNGDELNIAIMAKIQESLQQLVKTFIDSDGRLESTFLINKQWSDLAEEQHYLRQVAAFLEKEQSALAILQERIVGFRHPLPENLQIKPAENLPMRLMTTLFQTVIHPLESTQKLFNYIERNTPLPSYTVAGEIKKTESRMSQDLHLTSDLILKKLEILQLMQEKISPRLEELQKNHLLPLKIKAGSQNLYTVWLDAFLELRQSVQAIKNQLESSGSFEKEQLNSVLKLAVQIKSMKDKFTGLQLEAKGFKPAVMADLLDEVEASFSEAQNLANLIQLRMKLNQLKEKAEKLVSEMADQSLALAQGEPAFAMDKDVKLLRILNDLNAVYLESVHSELPAQQKNEIFKIISEEISYIAFVRSEYRDDYYEAMEAAVATTLIPSDDPEALHYQAQQLLAEMNSANRTIAPFYEDMQKRNVIDYAECQLSDWNSERASVFKEFSKISRQLNSDLQFIKKQCAALQQSGRGATLKAQWTLRRRQNNVAHTVEFLKEGIGSKEEKWSTTLLRCGLYFLYHSERIRSVAEFSAQAYQYWSTGESHLKAYADLFSQAEFVKRVDSMPKLQQAKACVQLNLIEGILGGFIEYPEDFEQSHPEAAHFLKEKFNLAPEGRALLLEPQKGAYAQLLKEGGPDRRPLSENDLNAMRVQFIGRQVQNYYQALGKVLEGQLQNAPKVDWTYHADSTFSSPISGFQKTPLNPLAAISEDLVLAIQSHQQGLPPDQNPHLINARSKAESIFETPLPKAWIEDWLFKQDWSDDRLENFSAWMVQSLAAQASYHLMKKADANSNPFSDPAVPPLLSAALGRPLSPSVQESPKFIHVISSGQKELTPIQEFEPLTSAAYRIGSLWSPIANALNNLWEQFAGNREYEAVIDIPKLKNDFDQVSEATLQLESDLHKIADQLEKMPGFKTSYRMQALIEEVQGLKQSMAMSQQELQFISFQKNAAAWAAFIESARKDLDGYMERYSQFMMVLNSPSAALKPPSALDVLPWESIDLHNLLQLEGSHQSVHAFLKDVIETPTNDKELAHTVGLTTAGIFGGKIGNEKLEGYQSIKMLEYQLQTLLSMRKALASSAPCSENSMEPYCQNFVNNRTVAHLLQEDPSILDKLSARIKLALEITRSIDKGVVQFQKRLRKEILALKEGDSFLFMSGYVNFDSGHALAYEIVKESAKRISFRIFNTGAGADYHAREIVEHSLRIFPYVEVSGIKISHFLSSSIIQALREPYVRPSTSIDWDEKDIYEGFIYGLRGKMAQRDFDLEDLKPTQYAGVCTLASLQASINPHLQSVRRSNQLHFMTLLRGLTSYFKQYHLDFQVSNDDAEARRGLMQDGLIEISRLMEVIRQNTPEALSSLQEQYVSTLLISMQRSLDQAVKQSKELSPESALKVNLIAPNEPVYSLSPSSYVDMHPNENEAKVLIPYIDPGWRDWTPNALSIVGDLQKICSEIHAINHQEYPNTVAVIKTIKSIAAKLPLQDPSFWEQLSPGESEKVLMAFSTLSQEFLWAANQHVKKGKKLTSDELLAQVKLHTVADQINDIHGNQWPLKIPGIYQEAMDHILFSCEQESPLLRSSPPYRRMLLHPSVEWRGEAGKLREYWKEKLLKTSHEDVRSEFFGFKTYPAGFNIYPRVFLGTNEAKYACANDKLKPSACWDGKQPHADLDWMVNWASRHQAIIQRDVPEIVGKPAIEQAVSLLTEFSHRIPVLSALQSISFATNFMITGTMELAFSNADFDKGISIEVQKKSKFFSRYDADLGKEERKEALWWELKYKIFGADIAESLKMESDHFVISDGKIVNTKLEWSDRPYSWRKEEQFDGYKGLHGLLVDSEQRSLRFNAAQLTHAPMDNLLLTADSGEIVLPNSAFGKMTSQQGKALLALRSHAETQIEETLAFFLANGNLLSQLYVRLLFRELLLEENLLEKSFQRDPTIAAALLDLCERERALAEKNQLDTALFFIDISALILFLAEREGIQDLAYSSVQEKYNTYLMRQDLSPHQKSSIYRHRLASYAYEKDLTIEGAVECLQSHFFTSLYDPTRIVLEDVQLKLIADDVIPYRFITKITQMLNGNRRDFILNQVLQMIYPDEIDRSWQPSHQFPHYTTADGQIQIDIIHAQIKHIGYPVQPLPSSIRSKQEFIDLFGEQSHMEGMALHINRYQFAFNGRAYRVEIDANGSLIFQLQAEKEWAQFQKYLAPQGPLNRQLLKNHHAWFKPASQQFSPYILFTNIFSGRPQWRALLDEDQRTVLSVQRMGSDGKPDGSIVVSPDNSNLNFLTRFVISEQIIITQQAGKIDRIEIPSFKLSFAQDSKDPNRLLCLPYSDFMLAQDASIYVEELGNLPHYLRLEPKKKGGKSIVLIPGQNIVVGDKGVYFTSESPDRTSSMKYYMYELDEAQLKRYGQQSKKSIATLTPLASNDMEMVEGLLFLAHLHLSERNYALANIYIRDADARARSIRSSIRNSTTKKMLEGIQLFGAIEGEGGAVIRPATDYHAEAMAIRLFAFYMEARDKQDRLLSIEIDFETAVVDNPFKSNFKSNLKSKLLSNYLRDLFLLPEPFRLSIGKDPQPEWIILDSISRPDWILSEQIQQRNHDLQRIINVNVNRVAYDEQILRMPALTAEMISPVFEEDKDKKPSSKDFVAKAIQVDAWQNKLILRDFTDPSLFYAIYSIAKRSISLEMARDILNKTFLLNLPVDCEYSAVIKELAILLNIRISHSLAIHAQIEALGVSYYNNSAARDALLLIILHHPDFFPDPLEWLKDYNHDLTERLRYDVLKDVHNPDSSKELELKNLKASLNIHKEVFQKKYIDQAQILWQQGDLMMAPKRTPKSQRKAGFSSNPLTGPVPAATLGVDLSSLKIARFNPIIDEKSLAEMFPQAGILPKAEMILGEFLNEAWNRSQANFSYVSEKDPIAIKGKRPRAIFAGLTTDPLLAPYFKEAKDQYDAYVGSKGVAPKYSLPDVHKVQSVLKGLRAQEKILQFSIENQESMILSMANRSPAHLPLADRHLNELALGEKGTLTLFEIVRILLIKQNFRQINPDITLPELQILSKAVFNYLIDFTELQRHRRVIAGLNDLSGIEKLSEIAQQKKISMLIAALKSFRQYDPTVDPQFLVLEATDNILLWKSQIDSYREMGMEKILELAMGQGKTSVHAPTQGWIYSGKQRISGLVLPESLVDPMGQELRQRSKEIYGQELEVMPIERDKISLKKIDRLLERFKNVQGMEKVLLFAQGDLQSLWNKWVEFQENHYIEKLDKHQKMDFLTRNIDLLTTSIYGIDKESDYAAIDQKFAEIFALLAEKLHLTVDEAHLIFSIFTSYNFSSGPPKAPDTTIVVPVGDLMQLLAGSEKIQKALRFAFQEKTNSHPSAKPFSKENYESDLKPLIIEEIVSPGFHCSLKDLQLIMNNFSEEEKKYVRAFLSNDKSQPEAFNWMKELFQVSSASAFYLGPVLEGSKKLLESDPQIVLIRSKLSIDAQGLFDYYVRSGDIKKIADFLDSHLPSPKRLANYLAVMKQVINEILPSTLGRKHLVDYGLDKSGTLMIPWSQGKPQEKSIHASLEERLVLTYLEFFESGVGIEYIRKEIDALAAQIKKIRPIPLNLMDTDPGRQFLEMTGGNPLISPFSMTREELLSVAKFSNSNPAIQNRLIQKYLVPLIKTYPKEIHSSAHILPLLANAIQLMTGTAYNVKSLPIPIMDNLIASNTQSSVLDALKTHSITQKVSTLPLKSLDDTAVIDHIYDHIDLPPGSIIDASGFLSGRNIVTLARAQLKRLHNSGRKEITGIITYLQGKEVVVTLDKEPFLYDKSALDKNSLAALWDLIHNTGSDLKLGETMSAVMIVDSNILLFNLMQAAMRLRELPSGGQTVCFLMNENDKRIVIETLNKAFNLSKDAKEVITLDDLIEYAYLNQVRQEGEGNVRATQEKLQMVLAKVAIKRLFAPGTTTVQRAQIYADFRSLWIVEDMQEPFEKYGQLETEELTIEVLKNYVKQLEAGPVVQAIRNNYFLYRGISLKAISDEWQIIINEKTGPLSEKMRKPADVGKTVKVDVNTDTQQSVKTEVKKEVHVHTENNRESPLREEAFEPRTIIPPPEELFSKAFALTTDLMELEAVLENDLSPNWFTSRGTGPAISVSDLISTNQLAFITSPLFSPELQASINYAPVQRVNSAKQVNYLAFDSHQQSCTRVALFLNPETQKMTVRMLSGDDIPFYEAEILKDRREGSGNEMRVALYQLQSQRFSHGKTPVVFETNDQETKFYQLIAQAKFMNGYVDYSEKELNQLKLWLEEEGAEKAALFFHHRIITFRDKSHQDYPGSVLSTLFSDLGVAEIPKNRMPSLTPVETFTVAMQLWGNSYSEDQLVLSQLLALFEDPLWITAETKEACRPIFIKYQNRLIKFDERDPHNHQVHSRDLLWSAVNQGGHDEKEYWKLVNQELDDKNALERINCLRFIRKFFCGYRTIEYPIFGGVMKDINEMFLSTHLFSRLLRNADPQNEKEAGLIEELFFNLIDFQAKIYESQTKFMDEARSEYIKKMAIFKPVAILKLITSMSSMSHRDVRDLISPDLYPALQTAIKLTITEAIENKEFDFFGSSSIFRILKPLITKKLEGSAEAFDGLFVDLNLAAHLLKWEFVENFSIAPLDKEQLASKILKYFNSITKYANNLGERLKYRKAGIKAGRGLILTALLDEVQLPLQWPLLSFSDRNKWLSSLIDMPSVYWLDMPQPEREKLKSLVEALVTIQREEGKVTSLEQFESALLLFELVMIFADKDENFLTLMGILDLPLSIINFFSLQGSLEGLKNRFNEEINTLELFVDLEDFNFYDKYFLNDMYLVSERIPAVLENLQNVVEEKGIDFFGKSNLLHYLNLLKKMTGSYTLLSNEVQTYADSISHD